MGRPAITLPPVPVETVQDTFALRQDGEIIRRRCHVDAFAREPAVYRGMVRVTHEGRSRRIAAPRVAWAIHFGSWPKGRVILLDGDETNMRAENLRLVRGGQNPASVGRSSLAHRRAVDAKLIVALANHPGLSVVSLGELVGLSESGACIRLGGLSRRGLAESPMCCPTKAWCLTDAGRAIAQVSVPLLLDGLDRSILSALALAPKRQLALVGALGCCSLTIKRRASLLAQRGLVTQDAPRAPFKITAAGREALGDAVPAPWVRPEVVAASLARDVAARSSLGGLTKSQAAVLGGRARAAQMFGRPRPDRRERLTG